MLSLDHLEIGLTETDVVRTLRSLRPPGGPEIRAVQFGYGEAVLQLAWQRLLTVPVELTVAVDGVRAGVLHLHVAWTNLGLVPAAVKQAGLGRAVAALGLADFWDGAGGLAIPLTYLQANFAASFEVDALHLTPERLLIRLRHIQAVAPALVRADAGADDADSLAEAVAAPPAVSALPPATAAPFSRQERRRYDEWRERLLNWSRSKLPPSLQPALPWVMLVPDLTVLLGRLVLESRLSGPVRTLLTAVLVYVLSPVDLVPDPIPVAGGIDDLALILLTLSQLQRQGDSEIVQENWSGEGEPLQLVRDGLAFIQQRFRGIARLMRRHWLRLRRKG